MGQGSTKDRNVQKRTHRPRNASSKGRIVQGTHRPRDASSKESLVQRMHRPRDKSSKERSVQGTQRPRDASSQGCIVEELTSGDTSAGDTLSWHPYATKSSIEKLPFIWSTYCITFKGTVPRDFRLLFFFMNQFPPSP